MDGASVPVPVPVPVPAAPVVPVDYTVLKRRLGGGGGGMEVRDASGVLAFRFAAAAAGGGRALLDAAGVVLVTVRSGEGEWQAFSGNSLDCRDIIYMAKLVSVCSNRREVHVFMPPTSNFQDTKPSYRLIGSTSRRACTIISGDSIVSQTNLLYKLKKVVYSTRKFRVTIYPGNDTVLVMAMVMNFFLEK
ncbi:protein LURP-one-related 7-like isoform X2 [Oryza brachyantha]|uniref:protein LURP-one-related 7-like isoform X2 n=1 Tax=Oryza brachyantha TaxID=4533 RepID=UPI0003EABEBF|nr:protein LURP-one-related 7-like isoform X2 [Oryza brachyantha]